MNPLQMKMEKQCILTKLMNFSFLSYHFFYRIKYSTYLNYVKQKYEMLMTEYFALRKHFIFQLNKSYIAIAVHLISNEIISPTKIIFEFVALIILFPQKIYPKKNSL